MREVVIQSWCDECVTNGDHTEAEAVDIVWRNREVSLDLCDQHIEPFREVDRLIAAYGHSKKTAKKKQPVEAAAPANGGSRNPSDVYKLANGVYQCPDCDRTLESPQGLGSHRYKSHGYRAA